MQEVKQKRWLAYLVAIFGIMCSFFLWYSLDHEAQALSDVPYLETYHPWIVLILGICISCLIATIIRITQLARDRALSLNQMNEDLKKEIAERAHAEKVKQKLEIALLQGQKLQAIGTLAGGIAHDFNNILYAIIGYIEIIREDVDKNSLVYKNLNKVLDASHRGQDLIARILAFSRRQHHQVDIINLKSTIEAALSLLRPTIPASVNLHFEPTYQPMIEANQTQLHQVLVNIINNAVDAMDGEGSIKIQMTEIKAHDPLLKQFPDILPQTYCKLTIEDDGHGMDQATIERIFEPFYTTKEVGKGTGLGLSIVHSIIKEHHGEVFVQSQLGQGTTFVILLPEHSAEQTLKT